MLELQDLLLLTFQPIMYQVLLSSLMCWRHLRVAGGTLLLLFISTPNRKGATVTAAIPLARNAIPSIIVSIGMRGSRCGHRKLRQVIEIVSAPVYVEDIITAHPSYNYDYCEWCHYKK